MPSSTSRVSNVVSTLNPLRRRPSLAESIRSVASSLSIGSNSSAHSSADKDKEKSKSKSSTKPKQKSSKITRSPSYYRPYSVYSQIMFPAVLREPEVTKKILEAILESPNGKRSISRLARTCKAFQEPALDVLWRELDSLVPILALFPPVLLKKPKKPGLGFSKSPSEGDWDKILQYGMRVRRVKYDDTSKAVSSSIFPIFDETRPVDYILPNLQQLVWKVETSAGLDYCRLFLNTKLENLSLEILGGGHSKTLGTMLADITNRMNLRSLSLVLPTTLPDSFVGLVSAQTGLRKLVLMAPGAVSPAVGRMAASLPELKSLQLDLTHRKLATVEGFFDQVPRTDQSSGQSLSSEESIDRDSGVYSGEEQDFSFTETREKLNGHLKATGPFASIRHLHLTGDASHIHVFLKRFSGPLVQLDLVIEDPPETSDWKELSQLLSEHFGRSLQALTISATGSSRFSDLIRSTSRAEPPTGRLSFEYFGSLPALNRLEIDLPESFQFTENDIRTLASSCPYLEELKLCPLARFPVQAGPPKLSLDALAPLMANCRRLHTLSVAVNARRASPEILAQRAFSSSSLRRLHVGHSWIHDFVHVAILISHLAPHLDSLKWFHEKNRPGFIESNARGWEKVQDTLPHLQSVRLAERETAKSVYIPPPIVPKTEIGVQTLGVKTINQGVLVRPEMTEQSIQAVVEMASQSIEVHPELLSVSIDATPHTVEASVDASISVREQSISAQPEVMSESVNASENVTKSVETTLSASKTNGQKKSIVLSPFQAFLIPTFFGLISLAYRIFIGYPIAIPFRIIHAISHRLPIVGRYVGSSSQDADISMESSQVRK
ncbi:hypothetical protein K435DRAFT_42476 [Dendrothele bispora CBS 962.96]|uniref:F-box domain-containing protein n=1 Tax=Dendrothele bispora (strain CBS 962.96) TaxID=1314807 RepID=A0A4S8MSL6_DENBC|nr:hypothetical protein K435DRAFT_42476 [Dendrothele bispora CBS 962.96]